MSARVETDPRITRRRRSIEKSRRRTLAIRAGVVAGAILLVWTAFWSPLLQVRRVRVLGGPHVSSEQLARAAGLDRGDNLLLLSTSAVEHAAERLPWVKSA